MSEVLTNDEIIKQIQQHRGPVMVGVLVRNDVMYVKCVKADLIQCLRFEADGVVQIRVERTEKLDIREGIMFVDAGTND